MHLPLKITLRRDIVNRALQSTITGLPNTIEQAAANLEAFYRLEIGGQVPLAARRDAVAGLIDSSLPSDVQDQISDAAVIAVFSDLVRAGLVEIEVDWIEDEPAPAPLAPENNAVVENPPVEPEEA